jgi:hypothetical protein
MSGDSPQLNPSALTVEQTAQVLSAAGGKRLSAELIRADIAVGAPTNENGTINLVMYAAWLLKDRARAN